MQLKLVKNKVLFHPETMGDLETLGKFPGLEKREGHYWCPQKGPVLRNVYTRLQKFAPQLQLKLGQGVRELFEVRGLYDLPEAFKFKTTPLKHQLIALRFLHTNQGGGLLLDPGLGKTKVCLDFAFLEGFKKVLVVCPKALMFVWEAETKTHRPELTTHLFETTDLEQFAEARKKVLWVVNYRKACLLKEELEKEKFDAIFVDEGLIKDPTSDQTNTLTDLARDIPVRVVMSGTLVNNTEADLFAPIRFMEPALLGQSFPKFRDTYMNTWMPDKKREHLKVTVGAKDQELLRAVLRACSLVMRKEEWLDLPPKEFVHVPVKPSTEQVVTYFDLLKNYVAQVGGNFVEVDNPLSMLAKLSQIGNGFLYDSPSQGLDDLFLTTKKPKRSPKDRKTYFFPEQPKIEALKKLYLESLTNKKFVLWYSMEAERVLLEAALKDLGVSFETVAGGEKRVREKVGKFNESELQCLLCQARTLNYGVTLLGDQDEEVEGFVEYLDLSVHTMVFYSLGYSLEIFLQQQDRIHRIGQKRKCTYYILFCDLPVEHKLVKALEDKQVLRNFVLEDWLHELSEQAGKGYK